MEYLEWAIPEKIQTGGVEDILFEKKKKKKKLRIFSQENNHNQQIHSFKTTIRNHWLSW